MKILIDMNLSPLWAPFLTGNGFKATHWRDVGSPSTPDAEIMRFAAELGYVVFTHDLDFGTLLAATKGRSPSVIQIRCQDLLPEGIGDLVLRSLRGAQEHLESGALVTVDVARLRIRMLPI